MILDDHWPLFRLSVRSARLELRLPTPENLAELAARAGDEVHQPGTAPFPIVGWTPAPSPRRERTLLQYHWRSLAEWVPERWNLVLVANADGSVVGSELLSAAHFAVTRTVTTGSWLVREHQGRGLGKEMRSGALALAFNGLGADAANSASFDTNEASIAVSRSLDYEENGVSVRALGTSRITELHFRMTRERWYASERPAFSIDGLSEECLGMFGADPR